MRHLLALSTVAAALASAPASAVIIPIDDFGLTQPASAPLTDSSSRAASCTNPIFGGTGSVTSNIVVVVSGANVFTRQLSVNLCNQQAPRQLSLRVIGGEFDINNGSGERSVGAIRYTGLSALVDDIPTNALSLAFAFDVVASDSSPVNVRAILSGVDLGTQQIGSNFTGQFEFNLPANPNFNGNLDLVFLGATGYDIAIESIGLLVRTPVSEPAILGILGVGLLALGLRRR